MKKPLITAFIAIVLLIPFTIVFFYIWFAIGMISASSAHSIKLPWVNQYKTSINSKFPVIKDINIYDKQGRVRFDFNVPYNMTLDQCKDVAKVTKDFITNTNNMKNLLDDKSIEQNNICLTFNLKKNTYIFECPIFVQTKDPTDNPNTTEENNYKIWYLQVNDAPVIELEF
ncbi:hypothetical protein [Clostridium fungisolvens]|uniref:Uncharacterized protein n=1 Tax=Clostridium fungisolvens TaxID=1604897 RepID=A0A6V8SLH4_9CLOT|nr:hypothetical protein [Clostridium fungisolvens]GFP77415.1 hypothetical protein bsdtw1_03543 [Clostridium fungisolvens]